MQEYIGVVPTNSKEDYRIELSKNIDHELNQNEYCSRSEVGREGVCSRRRVLTNKYLIVIIMKFKSSIQREMDRFFKELSNEDFNIRKVTKGAFTKARAKLNPWAFKRLNEVAINTFYDKAPYYTWQGKRVLAVDGTRFVLPNHPSIIEAFGQQSFGPKADSKRSLAMGSVLYDVLNLVAIDSEIEAYQASERDLLLKHLDKVKEGDLLLLDRGYPCFWLLFLLKAKKIDFCVRVKDKWWLKVKDFFESSEKERVVTFKLPKKDFKKLDGYPEMLETEITCRLVKVTLENGEIEILCTSLIDEIKYEHACFKGLYHFRWNEEEAYKLLKSRIEVERFSGKTALAIRQDFHAKILLLTLASAYAHPIETKVIAEFKADEKRKHNQKINRTNTIAMTQDILMGVMLKNIIGKALNAFDIIVFKTREIIRSGRSNPRKHRYKKPYSMNYKPL